MQMCTKCLEHFASRYSPAYENPTASWHIQLLYQRSIPSV